MTPAGSSDRLELDRASLHLFGPSRFLPLSAAVLDLVALDHNKHTRLVGHDLTRLRMVVGREVQLRFEGELLLCAVVYVSLF